MRREIVVGKLNLLDGDFAEVWEFAASTADFVIFRTRMFGHKVDAKSYERGVEP